MPAARSNKRMGGLRAHLRTPWLRCHEQCLDSCRVDSSAMDSRGRALRKLDVTMGELASVMRRAGVVMVLQNAGIILLSR
jgi:hypothetical protein